MRSDIDAKILFSDTGEPLELARGTPMRFGEPECNTVIAPILPGCDEWPEEAELLLTGPDDDQNDLHAENLSCQGRPVHLETFFANSIPIIVSVIIIAVLPILWP